MEYACWTRKKFKITNFLRASKKGFQDQKLFNWCRKEPPIVSGTHDLNWNGHHRKKSICNNFSQQKIKTNPQFMYLQSVVITTWFLNEVFFLNILNFRLNSKRVPDNLEKPLGYMLSHQILSRQTNIMIDEKHQNFSQQNI